jgi:hypothetical protein
LNGSDYLRKLILLFIAGILVIGTVELKAASSISAATTQSITTTTTASKTVQATGAVKSLRMAAAVIKANQAQYKTAAAKLKPSKTLATTKPATLSKTVTINTVKPKKSKTTVTAKKITKPVTVSRGSQRQSVEEIVKEVGSEYWVDPAELEALMWICKHESTRPGVVSRTGCKGLFQLKNPPAWMILGDAASEAKAGCEYIKRRYKTPSKAKSFWLSRHWY